MAKISIIVLQSVRFALAKSKPSFAKNRCETLGPELRRETSLSAPEFSAMNPDFPLLLDLRWCNGSKATRMLSKMRRFDMYALCVSETSFGKSFLKWLAMVFAIILQSMLQRLIGRKSFAISRFFILGMREMKAWLKFGDMVPVLRIESEVSTTSCPTMFQKDKRLETYHRGWGLTNASFVSVRVQLLLLCILGLELSSFGVGTLFQFPVEFG